jgi:hypothetical protein
MIFFIVLDDLGCERATWKAAADAKKLGLLKHDLSQINFATGRISALLLPPSSSSSRMLMKTRLSLLALALCLFPLLASAESESELRQFLYSKPNTYGWQPVEGNISYDFFKDGRLHVQGPDGEATMWQGTWRLKGDQVTLKVPDPKTNKTFTVTIDGDDLLLDDLRYHRYTP